MTTSGKINSKKVKKAFFIVCMLAIPVINLIVFWFYVNIDSILLAFQSNQPGVGTVWGFENFRRFFEEFSLPDSEIPIALRNTIIFFFSNLCITLPLSVALCYFLYKRICGYKAFRFIFYLPSIVSIVVLTMLFSFVFDSTNGIINPVLERFGLGHIIPEDGWLRSRDTAMKMVLLYCFWAGIGGNIPLLSGAIQRIPEELREDYRNFFSGDSLIEAKMVWGKQIMPGLYRQTGFQKMLDELQTLQKKRRDSASRTFFRLLVSCAAEVERRDDEIPAVEPLFLSCGLSENENEKLPEKIRCYLLENGEKAILVPEREFSENAWMF